MVVREAINYNRSTRIQDVLAFQTDGVTNDCTKISLWSHSAHWKPGKTKPWIWSSISKVRKNLRASHINTDAEVLEASSPETLGLQSQWAVLWKVILHLRDVKGRKLVLIPDHGKVISLICSNIFFTSFLNWAFRLNCLLYELSEVFVHVHVHTHSLV